MPFINPPYESDFSLRRGYGRGLRLTFMPAAEFNNSLEEVWVRRAEIEAGRLKAMNVHDDIYAFISTCIRTVYPDVGLFNYTGPGRMPSSMWPEAGRQIRWLAGRFYMRSLKQVDFKPTYSCPGGAVAKSRAIREYHARRVEIADTLSEFAETCDRWAKQWPLIVNHGI